MAKKFDLGKQLPELLARLVPNQRNAVPYAVAAARPEGRMRNREGVETLIEEARGAVDEAE